MQQSSDETKLLQSSEKQPKSQTNFYNVDIDKVKAAIGTTMKQNDCFHESFLNSIMDKLAQDFAKLLSANTQHEFFCQVSYILQSDYGINEKNENGKVCMFG